MSPSDPLDAFSVDRRNFLKLGLTGTVVLGTAGVAGSLAGCGAREEAAASGLRILRDADVAFFRALIPVMLDGTLPEGETARGAAVTEVLRRIDDTLARLGAPAQAQLRQLFDLLHLRPTRWLTTGVGAPWAQASAAEISGFLERWRNSSVGLLNTGYNVLNKLCCISWFSQREAWTAAGYPGPLAWAYQTLNS